MILISNNSDGWVDVDIEGTRYEYRIDSILIPTFLRVYKKSKWKALHILKNNNTAYKKGEVNS